MTDSHRTAIERDHPAWPEWPRNSPFSGSLDESQAHVWRVVLDDPRDDWNAVCQTLSDDERRRTESYKRPIDRKRFARSRGALRLLLGRYCELAPERLAWLVSPQGKPELDPACGGRMLHFNVSHSGEIALIALSLRRVGIDVERLRPLVSGSAIAKRYFSSLEVAQLESLPEEEQTPAFFRCWTRKEAFVKATGKGISSGLGRFSVSLLPGAAAALTESPPEEANCWQLFDLSLGSDYAAALSVEGVAGIGVSCRTWIA